MEKYIRQLISDINDAANNVSLPFTDGKAGVYDWISDEDESRLAPVRNLEDWTGITKVQLPPHERLTDRQVQLLLDALKKMLDAYNSFFVLQIEVPIRIQYAAIRDNFNQEAKVKCHHMGFFELCREGTEHGKCALGGYCQCAFYKDLFSGFIDEVLPPEEERARHLEFEISHLKKKYGYDWMKYYPYHLDARYDDENGNPHDYGFGDEEEEDDWWR